MADKTELNVISFNTLGVPIISKHLTERYVQLANIINETDVNIVAFQEVHTYLHLQVLKKFMQDFPYIIYSKFLYGPKGGLVIFSKLPFEPAEFIKFKERGSFRNISFYGKFIMNGTLKAKLRDFPVFILNTYFTTNPNKDWIPTGVFKDIQKAQLDSVRTIVQNIETQNSSAILAGDFNFIKDSIEYVDFIKSSHLIDTFSKFNIPTYLLGRKSLKFLWKIKFIDQFFQFNSKSSGRVDYIFLLNNHNQLNIKETEHIFDEKVKLFNGKESYLSDHIGLYAKIGYSN